MADTSDQWTGSGLASEAWASEQSGDATTPTTAATLDVPLPPEADDSWDRCVETFIHVWHGMDGFFGLLWLVYFLVASHAAKGGHPATGALVCVFLLAFFLLTRAAAGAVNYFKPKSRALQASSIITILLSITLHGIGFAIMLQPAKVTAYLWHHRATLHLSTAVHNFLTAHPKTLWTICFAWGGTELLRNMIVRQYRLLVLEEGQEEHLPGTSNRNNRAQPWWWKKDRGARPTIQDPLLEHPSAGWTTADRGGDYSMDAGVSRPPQSMFSRLFSRKNASNARDDGSVDFESVQEEWRSLSQEDPHWWSRDDAGNNNSN
eukprot:CAMPEP_0194035696 /NCGR_PEP_ID=MMETSP0009_2-20130614/8116_1 /TAXON_ID=210454 /ORGANISM="Grammatophora oceanica, Strain CCMP 410" /LENGTH=318 /DNA_ID=CAMNT_0038677155 /DNA_START=35 /DNA_END=991 /DNA_ORIENTATION=+